MCGFYSASALNNTSHVIVGTQHFIAQGQISILKDFDVTVPCELGSGKEGQRRQMAQKSTSNLVLLHRARPATYDREYSNFITCRLSPDQVHNELEMLAYSPAS